MRKALSIFLFLVLAIPTVAISQGHGDREGCLVCGMYVDVYQATSTILVYNDGRKASTCGVACMVRMVNDEGGPGAFKSITVHDFKSGNTVAAKDAVYVIGSKVIPDMIPNVIAFSSKEEADAFRNQEGGEIINFTQALLSISPMGMTMPARIKSAVVPASGALGVGVGYMKMTMDEVKLGSDGVDTLDFVKRPMQMMGPKEMKSSGEMLMVNYGLTDEMALGLSIANLKKEMEMYTMSGNATTSSENNGVGDLAVNLRYNIWKNNLYSKFFSVVGELSLPTGNFDNAFISSPGMQLGTGALGGGAGLLFSNRYQDFWFHYMLSYTTKLENGDDYKFGDITKFGAAVHYTPNYDLMLGLEVDGANYAKNEYLNATVDNSGGFRSYLTGIVNWRFLTALGGNFSIKAAYGLPLSEDLEHYTMGSMEKVQLGGGYLFNAMLSFKRRFQLN